MNVKNKWYVKDIMIQYKFIDLIILITELMEDFI